MDAAGCKWVQGPSRASLGDTGHRAFMLTDDRGVARELAPRQQDQAGNGLSGSARAAGHLLPRL